MDFLNSKKGNKKRKRSSGGSGSNSSDHGHNSKLRVNNADSTVYRLSYSSASKSNSSSKSSNCKGGSPLEYATSSSTLQSLPPTSYVSEYSNSSQQQPSFSRSRTAVTIFNRTLSASDQACIDSNTLFKAFQNTEKPSVNHDEVPYLKIASDSPSTSAVDNVASVASLGSISSPLVIISASQSPASPRKRKSTKSTNDKDSDFGYEPPSAKRLQRVPSLDQSEPGSVASSVYPSAIDDYLVQTIDTQSSRSDGQSSDTEYDGSVIPDSPSSLENSENEHTLHPDDEECESEASDCQSAEINSDTSSPYPAVYKSQHNGEKTPASPRLVSKKAGKSVVETTNAKSLNDDVNPNYYCMTPAAECDPPRQCPLPSLSWANSHEVWEAMCRKDQEAACCRDASMLERHPGLQPRMRAILLDWLIEVCEVYKLHRETYYLAVDYLDRYLTSKFRVQKTHLQLIGITCLFVAAKVEEIYPPKIGEFAYVTDGACQEKDILLNEILLLQALDWDINPVTPVGWLSMYMQLNVTKSTPKIFAEKTAAQKAQVQEKENKTHKCDKSTKAEDIDEGFIFPQFSALEFVQTAQLLDLCSLDVGVTHFPYSTLAAAAMSHTFNKETALRCSGLDWQTIHPCARWMEPFFHVISAESEHLSLSEQNEQVSNQFGLGRICPNISTDDSHIIQTHSITMGMFDHVTQIQEELIAVSKTFKYEASPATGLICPEGLLTPPASSRKPLDVLDEDLPTTTAVSTVPASTSKSLKGNTINVPSTTAIVGATVTKEKALTVTNQKTT